MAAKIDQKAYLQKYLSGPSKDKKKKKKRVVKGTGLKIIDDDIDVTKLRPLDRDEFDVYGEGEDAPQIAGIIDERPEEVKKLEQFKTTTKWKVINQDDGFNSKLQIEEIKKDIKEVEKDNEILFGKMYSDSEDDIVSSPQRQSKEMQTQNKAKDRSKMAKNNSDSDLSPPRKQTNEVKSMNNVKKVQHHSDSDPSPPRREDNAKNSLSRSKDRTSRDRDLVIARKQESKRQEKTRKPSRWGSHEDTNDRSNQNSGHSTKHNNRMQKKSSNREYQRNASSDSDMSPHRKSIETDSNAHVQGKKQKNYDSDLSPPRRSRRDLPKRNKSVDSDLSPPRKNKNSQDRTQTKEKKTNIRRNSSDSDLSPPRKRHNVNKTRKHSDDSDLSPPRRKNNRDSNREKPMLEKDRDRVRRNSNSPPPTNKKMAKTLEGKMAGLQDARQLRQENHQFRQREEEAFNHMTDDVSGRNAKAVSRRKKRETSADRQKQSEKAERQKEIDEKYKKWSKGIKQQQAEEERLQEYIHESNKPLARYKDDGDLEGRLRGAEREGDPMLRYMREKKRHLGPEMPIYKGNFPPNRFNIRPGYRWDGVDRSNGYEKKYFDEQSKRKAQQADAYKWSTEDL